ncbi:type IV pilin protein [Nitrospira sp. Nam74]
MAKLGIVRGERGFTLSEVMVVVAIIGILASIAGVSYTVFSDKAKTVEAETALVEVNRLETMYYEARGQYSSDLQAIGYRTTPALKYYTVEVEVPSAASGVGYRATAKPKGDVQLEPWVLTRYENGNTVLEKLTLPAMAESRPGGGSGGSGDSSGPTEGSLESSGVSASTSKGPGTVIQTINGSSAAGGSMSSDRNLPAHSNPVIPSQGQ